MMEMLLVYTRNCILDNQSWDLGFLVWKWMCLCLWQNTGKLRRNLLFCCHLVSQQKKEAQPVCMTYRPAHDSGKRANLRGHAADLDTTHTSLITDIDRPTLRVR